MKQKKAYKYRFSPSEEQKRILAQTFGCCRYVYNWALTLDIRAWTCPECGAVHDRDINAAKNILAAGLAVAACGEAVRPGAVKAKPGKPQRSRKAS